MENIFKKCHTKNDLIISSITIIAGVGLFFASKAVGITIVLCGVLMLFIYKTGYKHEDSNTIFTKTAFELSVHCRQSVLDFLEGRKETVELIHGNEGGTLRLEVWYNKEERIAYAQLSDYYDYIFHPIAGITKFEDEKAQTLISKL